MKTIHLNTTIGDDGLLKIETQTDYRNVSAEIVVVLHPVSATDSVTGQGYPKDFFEQLDAIEADDLLERPTQGILETRDPLE